MNKEFYMIYGSNSGDMYLARYGAGSTWAGRTIKLNGVGKELGAVIKDIEKYPDISPCEAESQYPLAVINTQGDIMRLCAFCGLRFKGGRPAFE